MQEAIYSIFGTINKRHLATDLYTEIVDTFETSPFVLIIFSVLNATYL